MASADFAVHIGQLPAKTANIDFAAELNNVFGPLGASRIFVARSNYFGTAHFSTAAAAAAAVAKLNGVAFHGANLVVEAKKPREDKPPRVREEKAPRSEPKAAAPVGAPNPRRVYFSPIAATSTGESVKAALAKFGTVVSVQIKNKSRNAPSALATFESEGSAAAAVAAGSANIDGTVATAAASTAVRKASKPKASKPAAAAADAAARPARERKAKEPAAAAEAKEPKEKKARRPRKPVETSPLDLYVGGFQGKADPAVVGQLFAGADSAKVQYSKRQNTSYVIVHFDTLANLNAATAKNGQALVAGQGPLIVNPMRRKEVATA